MQREPASVDVDGPKVRRMRKLAGHSTKKFASIVGITPGHLRHIEVGRRCPSPEVFARVCDALGVMDRKTMLRHAS